jgi:hypothetical protein
VNLKSKLPFVRDENVVEAVRYVSVACNVIYDEPVVVETSSLNISEPGDVPNVHVVPPVALPDLTFNCAFEPPFVTTCVSPLFAVVVAVFKATEPNAIDPSETDTARFVAVTVAVTVPVVAAFVVRHPKIVSNRDNTSAIAIYLLNLSKLKDI